MADKLQELTDKIYQEGIDKAKQEAEKIVADAKQKAEKILQDARKQEEEIVEKAHKDADDLRENVQSEVKLSAKQAIASLKQRITELIRTKILDEPIDEVIKDKDFLKKIIEKLIRNWNPTGNEPIDISLLLPREDERQLAKYFASKGAKELNNGLEIQIDDKLQNGFKIGPKDGNYIISFTDKDFEEFFKAFLRPRMIRLLYGREEE